MKYAIRYTETYARTYFVEAESYEESLEKLENALSTDSVDGPNYCIGCDFFNKTTSFTDEEIEKVSIDVR